jgi:hypothetical protein
VRQRGGALELSLHIRVARCSGQPVRPASWVEDHVRSANGVLAPHGIRLVATQDVFVPEKCVLLDRADRDALAAHLPPRGVIVLLVERVRDLDLVSYSLMGVHWRYHGDEARYQGRRWIILTTRARPPVLAHELCHYFGLSHDPAGGNLMTPGPSAPVWRQRGPKPEKFSPVLTVEQGKRLRAAVKRMQPSR